VTVDNLLEYLKRGIQSGKVSYSTPVFIQDLEGNLSPLEEVLSFPSSHDTDGPVVVLFDASIDR